MHWASCLACTNHPLILYSHASQSATLPATLSTPQHALYWCLFLASICLTLLADVRGLSQPWVSLGVRLQGTDTSCCPEVPALTSRLLGMAPWMLVMTSKSICKVKCSSLPKPVTPSRFPTAVNNGTKLSFHPPTHI